MNANELADAMMSIEQPHPTWTKAATMLRQQQAEIEALKSRELTDEEIDEISKEVWERPWLEVHRKFAKAILRKAQEK